MAFLLGFVLFLVSDSEMRGQPANANYDESKVPAYKLPDPLTSRDGKKIRSQGEWNKIRRPEILELYQHHVYGKSAPAPKNVRAEILSEDKQALGGLATRREIRLHFTGDNLGPKMDLLLYLPNQVKGKVPVFLGLNFDGNQSVHSDPGIQLSTQWMRPSKEKGVTNNRATEDSRGKSSSRWPVEMILEKGYGLATAYYGDLEPDFAEAAALGVRGHFRPERAKGEKAEGDDWGAIGAWAWGLSRALDYLEKDRRVDGKKVAVIGHSRLGKTALWAGAQDRRFAMVISNNSGEGGAAISRRRFGETVQRINTSFPHWFCANFKKYNNNEDALPVDQHLLVALIAPRPVYIASAEEDQWADPKGEFLAGLHAEPVYRLFKKKGVEVQEMPRVNQPVGEFIGYHMRSGKHDVTRYDWEQYLRFADRHLGK